MSNELSTPAETVNAEASAQANHMDNRLLVDAATVAKLLSISKSTLYALNAASQVPAPIRLGRSVRWGIEELRAWVNFGCPARYRWEAVRQQLGFGTSSSSKGQKGVRSRS